MTTSCKSGGAGGLHGGLLSGDGLALPGDRLPLGSLLGGGGPQGKPGGFDIFLWDQAFTEQRLRPAEVFLRVMHSGIGTNQCRLRSRKRRFGILKRRLSLQNGGLRLRRLLGRIGLGLLHLDLILADGGRRLLDLPIERLGGQLGDDLAPRDGLPVAYREAAEKARDRRRNGGFPARQGLQDACRRQHFFQSSARDGGDLHRRQGLGTPAHRRQTLRRCARSRRSAGGREGQQEKRMACGSCHVVSS